MSHSDIILSLTEIMETSEEKLVEHISNLKDIYDEAEKMKNSYSTLLNRVNEFKNSHNIEGDSIEALCTEIIKLKNENRTMNHELSSLAESSDSSNPLKRYL